MKQAHHRVAVLDGLGEPLARQAEVKRDRLEHARAGLLERCVELGEGLAEFRHFARPDIRSHEFGERVPSGQLAPDMPELLEVVHLGVLGGLHAEGRVTPGPAAAFDLVGLLGFGGQCEEALGHRFGAVDQLLRDAVIADHRETVFLEASAQLLGDLLERAGDGNGSNLRHGQLFW